MSNMVPSRMTEPLVCTVDPGELQPELLERAVTALAHGELVVAPTETRYGLLARADDSAAMDRLYRAKGRSSHTPVAVFVGGVVDIERHAVMTESSNKLAERFLPGLASCFHPIVNQDARKSGKWNY